MGEIEIRREAYGIHLIGWEPDSNAIYKGRNFPNIDQFNRNT